MKKIKSLIKKYRINSYQIIVFCLFFLSVFLIINIASSQIISPLYVGVAEGRKTDTAEYLKKIRSTSLFDAELKRQESIHGPSIVAKVFEEELAVDAKIKKFEQLLEKNPLSRDALNGLYLLYREKGNNNQSQYYLQRVKEIDPNFL